MLSLCPQVAVNLQGFPAHPSAHETERIGWGTAGKKCEIKNDDVLWIHGLTPSKCSEFAAAHPCVSPPTHPLMKPSGWMGHSPGEDVGAMMPAHGLVPFVARKMKTPAAERGRISYYWL
jgi:hypothetical protein